MNSTQTRHYANQIRLEQADVRTDLRGLSKEESPRLAVQLLQELPQSVQYMRLVTFLGAIKGIGDHTALQIIRAIEANAFRRIGPELPSRAADAGERPLTDRQRSELITTLSTYPR
jgi:hypothetical protein